jgi:hypothetical protein
MNLTPQQLKAWQQATPEQRAMIETEFQNADVNVAKLFGKLG